MIHFEKGEVIMATVKKTNKPVAVAVPAAKEAVKAEVKAEVKAAPEVKKAEAVKKEVVKKEVVKKEPVKKAAAKTETKKAPAKKAELKSELHVQFAGKSYTEEELVKIAKDVWKYDLKQKVSDLTSLELYVKPEEQTAYYVMNKEFTGSFAI